MLGSRVDYMQYHVAAYRADAFNFETIQLLLSTLRNSRQASTPISSISSLVQVPSSVSRLQNVEMQRNGVGESRHSRTHASTAMWVFPMGRA
jgi:hypothetical protein